ncbi:outer membrane beta-barrel protein [Methylobacterium oryzisoli]|uniref:outer membrane beta-barrel protein n=1 Tax=Methylobacterium oryzisoli TaxID=3385502 RepID=UPI0038928564
MDERPRTREQDRPQARRPAALGLALAACLAVGQPALAQSVRLPDPVATPSPAAGSPNPVGEMGLRGSANPAVTARPASAGERRREPPRRPSRPPARAMVRAVTQVPSEDLRLRPIVQVPVTGVPDPVLAAPLLRRRIDPADPYAPLGVEVGSITVFPVFQQSVGYDTNPDRAFVAKASPVLRSEGEVRFQSDWSVHALAGELRGAYNTYPENRAADRPDGDGAVRLRLDAARDTRIEIEGRYLITTQRVGSPDLNAVALRERPIVAAYGGTVGVVQDFNRLQVSLRGLVDRQTFDDAVRSDGTVIPQGDRNANTYGLRLRTGYEIRPGLTPFVDALVDTRIHDFAVDFSGYRRDSDGLTLRAGSTFELSRILTGEVSGGWLRRTYVDRRLRDVTGPVLDGALIWAATPLTTVRVGASTGVIETVIQGASGVLTQTALLEVTHDLRRNLRLTLLGSVFTNDYKGVNIHEDGYAAGIRVDYRLNRWLGVRASYTHENLRSNVVRSSYDSDTFLVGVRVNP